MNDFPLPANPRVLKNNAALVIRAGYQTQRSQRYKGGVQLPPSAVERSQL
jgi:hypothetical protein